MSGAAQELLGRRLFRSAAWITVGNTSSRILSLISAIIAARLLSQPEFGTFGLIQSTLSTFGILATMSLGVAATRQLAIYRDQSRERVSIAAVTVLGLTVVLTIITCTLLIVLSHFLAQRTLKNEALEGLLRFSMLLLGATAVSSVLTGMLSGLEKFGLTALMAGIQNVTTLIGCATLVRGYGLYGLIASYAAGFSVSVFCGLHFMREVLARATLSSFRRHVREELVILSRFCVPKVVCGLLVMLAFSGAQVLIARQHNGYQELAYFTAADRFRQFIFFVTGFIGTALLPLLSNVAWSGKIERTDRRAVEMGIRWTALLVVPLTTALAFSGPQLMAMFGHAYFANWSVLMPVLIWAGLSAITGSASAALLAYDNISYFFWQQVGYAAVSIVCVFRLKAFGAVGLAGSLCVAIAVTAMMNYWLSEKAGIYTSRAKRTYFESCFGVCAACVCSWIVKSQYKLLLAAPAIAVSIVISAKYWSDASERNAVFSWVGLKARKLSSRQNLVTNG